jgi:hypothetical protein
MTQIACESGGIVTNVEVLMLFEENGVRKSSNGITINSSTSAISNATVDYMSRSFSRYMAKHAPARQNISTATVLKNRLLSTNLGLTEAELAQLINHCPKYAVEVHMVSKHY